MTQIIKSIMKLKTIGSQQDQKERDEETFFNFCFPTQTEQCKYQNIATLEKTSNSIRQNQIKISNHLCQQNGEFLQKLTVIKFNNEVITIKDRYHFTELNQNIHQEIPKRVHIFKRFLNGENLFEGKKRITKNLAKNFIKAFLNYLELVKDQDNKQLVDCKMKLISSRQNYNNSFIQQIVEDSELEPYFSKFLTQFAPNWIEKSKIKDKDIHVKAVQIFQRLCDDQKQSKPSNLMELQSYSLQLSEESEKVFDASKDDNENGIQSLIANQSNNSDFNRQ